jgi:beta-mannosidase
MEEPNYQVIDKRTNSFLLNGIWKYLPDKDGNFSINDVKKMWEGENSFSEMQIPGNWQLSGLDNFSGSVWFTKNFNFESEVNDDVKVLKFYGVDYFADVWLNWNYLGHHEGYFQHFIFRIDKELNVGNNIIVVKVTSFFEEPYKVWPSKKKQIKGIFNHHDCRPGGTSYEHGQDQNTGGIWNDVLIKYGYPVYINSIKISSDINYKTNKANLHFNIKYISSIKSVSKFSISFEITAPSSQIINHKIEKEFLPGVNEVDYSFQIENPELWWCWDLGKPNLYKIKISSEIFEEQKINYGIREVRLDEKKQFFINNKRLFLRGTNIIPEQFLSALLKEKISRIVKLIKEANINIVRVHAHVNRKELYEEFDKHGILVWQDFSLQWTYDESSEFIDNAAAQIKDMVNQLYNYASIVFWCCHNEPGEQTYSLDPVLFQTVKNEDSRRIIRQSSNYEEHPYDGWYWGNKEHFAAAPMGPLVTEFGAQALPNLSSLKRFIPETELFPPKWGTWKYHDFQADQTFNIAKVNVGDNIESFIKSSQDYQADLLQTAVDFYRRTKFKGINGIFQFMFIDCWPSITWSIVDYYLEPKPAYFTLKKAFQPIYISINVRQDQYFAGKKFMFDIYLINDLHKNFPKCKLDFFIDEKFYDEFDSLSIDSDNIILLNHNVFNLKIPDDLKTCNHKMEIELIDKNNNEVLSVNDFSFLVVEHP